MSNWIEELKNETLFELKKREYNNMPAVVEAVKSSFEEIKNQFAEVRYIGEPVMSTNFDETQRVYELRFNDVSLQNNVKVVRCKVVGQADDTRMEIYAVVPEIKSHFLEIGLITLGEFKPRIKFFSDSRKVKIFNTEEEFSIYEFNWLIQQIFEYKKE
ncbi:hypothetical protein [Exiguobacterium acetylicum]|uniref:hypothetical protein n=1 Tax=Exiguobacterium acetylicum TaxID=41170 RepID=UPI00301B45D2